MPWRGSKVSRSLLIPARADTGSLATRTVRQACVLGSVRHISSCGQLRSGCHFCALHGWICGWQVRHVSAPAGRQHMGWTRQSGRGLILDLGLKMFVMLSCGGLRPKVEDYCCCACVASQLGVAAGQRLGYRPQCCCLALHCATARSSDTVWIWGLDVGRPNQARRIGAGSDHLGSGGAGVRGVRGQGHEIRRFCWALDRRQQSRMPRHYRQWCTSCAVRGGISACMKQEARLQQLLEPVAATRSKRGSWAGSWQAGNCNAWRLCQAVSMHRHDATLLLSVLCHACMRAGTSELLSGRSLLTCQGRGVPRYRMAPCRCCGTTDSIELGPLRFKRLGRALDMNSCTVYQRRGRLAVGGCERPQPHGNISRYPAQAPCVAHFRHTRPGSPVLA